MKMCFKCKIKKPLSDFYKHRRMADGHLNKCKVCAKNDVNKHREDNLEKVRAYDRNRPNKDERAKKQAEYHKYGKGREVAIIAKHNYKEKNPLRIKANNAVSNALRDKKLIRPNHCEICNIECKPHGHHDDYKKPLSVRWLCVSCHNEYHTFVREIYRSSEVKPLHNPFGD